MKLVTALAGIAILLASGCSSTPERGSAAIEATDRVEYAKMATRRLDDFEKQAADLQGDRQRDAMAAINDARAEIRAMEQAPDWQSYRGRVDSRLDHARNLTERAE